jgi:hypothetical protein
VITQKPALTKAERRELQTKQRAEKDKRKQEGGEKKKPETQSSLPCAMNTVFLFSKFIYLVRFCFLLLFTRAPFWLSFVL